MTNDTHIIISRTFAAPREIVWQAWTDPETVKKWWGPKDFWSPSIKIDFKVGGKYLYCMHGPKDSPFDKDLYSAGEYKEIIPLEKIVAADYFSDEFGNKTSPTEVGLPPNMPLDMFVTTTFDDIGGTKTKLSIIYNPGSPEIRQAMIDSKIEEGWSSSLDKLASIL
ncbi:SRPBCC domain-containing protein [Candidatus Microgenomates bacterium]|nr:SRPBCC domain-containing protein [Candidatus Microgenomates bacterium]